jgi:hypothetical protein
VRKRNLCGRVNHISYVAPFWSTFFWADVDYGPYTKDLPLAPLQQLANQTASQAVRDGTLTDTAKSYGATIGGK